MLPGWLFDKPSRRLFGLFVRNTQRPLCTILKSFLLRQKVTLESQACFTRLFTLIENSRQQTPDLARQIEHGALRQPGLQSLNRPHEVVRMVNPSRHSERLLHPVIESRRDTRLLGNSQHQSFSAGAPRGSFRPCVSPQPAEALHQQIKRSHARHHEVGIKVQRLLQNLRTYKYSSFLRTFCLACLAENPGPDLLIDLTVHRSKATPSLRQRS